MSTATPSRRRRARRSAVDTELAWARILGIQATCQQIAADGVSVQLGQVKRLERLRDLAEALLKQTSAAIAADDGNPTSD